MSEVRLERLKSLIKDVPNFPKEGIMFKDITPVLASGEDFQNVIHMIAENLPKGTTKLLGIESRGFIFGSALAHHLGIGLVLVRKPGKLPRETYSVEYDLEYGTDQLMVHKEDLTSDDQVVVIDDVLATGGTAQAVEKLCAQAGAKILGHSFVIELGFLGGAKRLAAPVQSLVSYTL